MLICTRPKIYDVDLIALAALVLFSLTLWYGAIDPLRQKTVEYQHRQEGQLQEQQQSQRELESLQHLNDQRILLAQQLSEARDVLRENTGTANMLRITERICNQWNLLIDQVIPGQARQTPHFTIHEMELDLAGQFPDLIVFVHQMRQQAPYVCVSQADIEMGKQAGETVVSSEICNMKLKLDIFSP